MRRGALTQLVVLAGLALLATWWGWRVFWYLTDDAFIVFRYVANRQAGWGYAWNPPPFLPVEGYTCFLWVALLDLASTLTGRPPTELANPFALVFSLGSVGLLAAATTLIWRRSRSTLPLALPLTVALAYTLSNRSFLAWTSSGLETALFDFLLHGWLFSALLLAWRGPRWLSGMAVMATLLALTRPEGSLYVGATVCLGAWLAVKQRRVAFVAASLSPFVLVVVHLLGRRVFYGAWLPNTAYAKVAGAWPEAGLRYGALFVVEYALWLWVLPVGIAVWRRLQAPSTAGRGLSPAAVAAAMAAPVILQVAGYLLVVGGDNFEFRCLAFAVPLLGLGLAWSLLALRLRWPSFCGVALAVLLAASVLPWTQWRVNRQVTQRADSFDADVTIAPALPTPLRPYARLHDGLQTWLLGHNICIRHQDHVLLWQHYVSLLPSREQGARAFEGVDNPVISALGVGVVGWTYPHVAILDEAGLNDWVVAHSPYRRAEQRIFAHDRSPPPEYVLALSPVAKFTEAGLQRMTRSQPLSDDDIREIEARFRGSR